MLNAEEPSPPRRFGASSCEHDYRLDKELEGWVCTKCGKLFELMTQVTRHECGPDCDIHGDISAIG